MDIKALLFDKDGTLFDFHATWGVWAARLLDHLSAGDTVLRADLAGAIDYDLATSRFRPTSVAIAGTMDEIVEAMLAHLPGRTASDLAREMHLMAQEAPQVAAAPLDVLLPQLRGMGLKLGVMTNDSEASAKVHLTREAALDYFDCVFGADSGHGAKPDPAPLLALAHRLGVAPAHCVMLGDSLHDLQAAKAAGMVPVGVLTGPASAEDLAPHARAVLGDIGELPQWLARQDCDLCPVTG
ncbi:HAD family hydrolase [Thioclava sp. GXIMD2076]|uniref:HAD family hydrolase n=1 Tax=Thioclava sp. GXIMD2076 TaxID=3131931 RepID=UPI0030CDC085